VSNLFAFVSLTLLQNFAAKFFYSISCNTEFMVVLNDLVVKELG